MPPAGTTWPWPSAGSALNWGSSTRLQTFNRHNRIPDPSAPPAYSLLDCTATRVALGLSGEHWQQASGLCCSRPKRHEGGLSSLPTSSQPTPQSLTDGFVHAFRRRPAGRSPQSSGHRGAASSGHVVRRPLRDTIVTVFNLDKMGYASDLSSIEEVLSDLGDAANERHRLQQVI